MGVGLKVVPRHNMALLLHCLLVVLLLLAGRNVAIIPVQHSAILATAKQSHYRSIVAMTKKHLLNLVMFMQIYSKEKLLPILEILFLIFLEASSEVVVTLHLVIQAN